MKKSIRTSAVVLSAVSLSIVGSIQADTLAYWKFQDAAPGTLATNLASEVHADALTGMAGNTGGTARNPAHSADVPGTNIFSGIYGGALLNANNRSSLYFTNAAAYPSQTNSTSGGYVVVTNHPVYLCPTNFTIEFFAKVARDVDWPELVGKSREYSLSQGAGASWGFDMDRSDPLKVRMDTQPLNQIGSTNGFNQNCVGVSIQDGKWHHVALTYDSPTKKATLYIDYITKWNMTTTHEVVYDTNNLVFGKGAGSNQAFDGWLDEIRLSDKVLQPAQFLSTATVPADAPLYWQFDDAATVPSTATSLFCEVGSPWMDGTAKGAIVPTFSTNVPLAETRKITQGYKGAVVNTSNRSSLFFVNAGLPGNLNSGSGGQVSASGFQSPSNFTAEAFIKVNRHANYMLIAGKVRIADNPSWSMEVDANGQARCRLDTYPADWNLATNTYSDNAAVGFNQTFSSGVSVEDGKWHHVALSYETATKRVKLYVDYVLRVNSTTINPIVYTGGDILIGNGAGEYAFDGWIDEVRITPRVLGTNEFLYTLRPAGTVINVH